MPGTTPVYGFPYPEPTDLVANYPALGQDLAEDIEAVLPTISGLAPATPTSIANSGGSASLTSNTVTFTTVNSVSLNGCFSASYDNYRILVTVEAVSGSGNLQVRMRSAGTDNTSAIYDRQLLYSTSTTVGASALNNQTAWSLFALSTTQPSYNTLALEIFRPNLAVVTTASHNATISEAGSQYQATAAYWHETASAFTGFTLLMDTNNVTGKVSVYGYKN